MKTNANLLALVLLTATLAAPLAQAQTTTTDADNSNPTAAPTPPTPGNDRPGRDHHGPHHHDAKGVGPDRIGQNRPGPGGRQAGGPRGGGLTSLTTVSGTVGQWTGNDDYILDGFTIGSGASATTVKFPSHLGQQVQKAVKPGATVSVTGYPERGKQGESRFHLTSLTAGKTTILDGPPTRPAQPTATPEAVTETGKIADYQLDREGRVRGLVLDNKSVVQIPPHVAGQLSNLATKGQTITVQGYPKQLHEGQVQLQKTNILRAQVLTIDNKQYLVR